MIANVLRVCSKTTSSSSSGGDHAGTNGYSGDGNDVTAEESAAGGEREDVMEIKWLFLNDMYKLFDSSADNRRILLQQSVWQDWLLDTGYLRPSNGYERKCQEIIYDMFHKLLYHAIKLEWGGWRVWVDTLAIIHAKVSARKQLG